MGKIANYRTIHDTALHYHHVWQHESTGETLAVVDHTAVHDDGIPNRYAIVRLHTPHTTPYVILRLVMSKNRARRIAVDIARENPIGLFDGLNLPVWGQGHHVELSVGHVDILEKHVDPDMDNESLKAHLRQRGYHNKAETV